MAGPQRGIGEQLDLPGIWRFQRPEELERGVPVASLHRLATRRPQLSDIEIHASRSVRATRHDVARIEAATTRGSGAGA
jgi:hypothetical protein